MLREFVKLVDEAVDEGFDRGLNLFMEGLEEDLNKNEVLAESGGFDAYMTKIFEADGIDVKVLEEADEELDEAKIDAMLEEFKKEGIVG